MAVPYLSTLTHRYSCLLLNGVDQIRARFNNNQLVLRSQYSISIPNTGVHRMNRHYSWGFNTRKLLMIQFLFSKMRFRNRVMHFVEFSSSLMSKSWKDI